MYFMYDFPIIIGCNNSNAPKQTWKTVDIRLSIKNVVGQSLSGRQNVGVMCCNKVLSELLQLLATHLLQSFYTDIHIHTCMTAICIKAICQRVPLSMHKC